MHLGPARRGEAAVDLEQQEARGVEPRLAHAVGQVGLAPGALLGVVGEGRVVLLDPGPVVAPGLEGPQGRADRNVTHGDRQAHAEHLEGPHDLALGAVPVPACPPVDVLVAGQDLGQQRLVDPTAAHLEGRAAVAHQLGVAGELAAVVAEPVLGDPAVHDQAAAALVDRLAAQAHLGAVEQVEDVEALVGGERRSPAPASGHARA